MDKDVEHVTGGCHCGAVRFEATLATGLRNPIRCNCSVCRMRGGVLVFARLGQLHITKGAEHLAEYQFNSGAAKHHFCARCGIYTHHQRRFDPSQYAVSVACLDGVSPYDFDEVPVVDGHRHPLDHGGGSLRVIGTTRFEPTNGETR